MLGWSIPLFRVLGIPLRLHGSFLALLGYVAWEGWRGAVMEEVADTGAVVAISGWPGLRWGVAVLLAFFTCVVLHELGHCLTARRFGIGTRRILLLPIGGMADMEAIPREPRRELLMTFAGPAVNFAIAGVLWLAIWLVGNHAQTQTATNLRDLAEILAHWNLLMGTFNLLPAFPMDGGRILRALLATRLPYVRATFWAATVGKLLGVTGGLLAIFWLQRPLLAVLFAFICWAGEMEYRLVKRREVEAEHWQNWWAERAPATVRNEPLE
jgi:Zn-dependent protease